MMSSITTAKSVEVLPMAAATLCPRMLPTHSASQPQANTACAGTGVFFAASAKTDHSSTSAVM